MRLHEFDTSTLDAGNRHGVRLVRTHRIAGDEAPLAEACSVVEETALFIEVKEVGTYTLMWTRTDAPAAAGYLPDEGVLGEAAEPDVLALAAGFLFTEGMIDALSDLTGMAACPQAPHVLRVTLADPARAAGRRAPGLIASACGLCGEAGAPGDPRPGLPAVRDTLRIDPAWLDAGMTHMRMRQRVFDATGGAHAAAVFAPDGTLLASAEDLGRHNALDKAIGLCLLRRRATTGGWALLSGRVSLEMVAKAARAGLELVAAVSAPSSLAVDTADRLALTLCGFVRERRVTAFTHPHRLTPGAL